MKAITLTQPWATLVAIGAKKIETRSWNTKYRGPLAIHAAKGFPREAQELCFYKPFRDYLCDYVNFGVTFLGEHHFPLGKIIAICELINCFTIRPFQSGFHLNDGHEWIITHDERAFGDYSPGRFAWILENIKMLPEPIFAKGFLGLWEAKEIS